MALWKLCLPNLDECFSSWVYRNIVKYPRVRFLLSDVHVTGSSGKYGDTIYEDPDFDIKCRYVQEVLLRLELTEAEFSSFFEGTPGKLLPLPARRFFCPDCLRDDVARGSLPYWRKEWCRTVSVFCSKHEQRLACIYPTFNFIERGWQAFSQIASASMGDHTGTRFYEIWSDTSLQQKVFGLTNKVLSWYLQEEGVKPDIALPGSASVEAFDLALEIFTQAPGLYTVPGHAWYFSFACKLRFQRFRRHYPWLLENGAYEVNINQRICAVIMAGQVLGIITENDLCEIHEKVDEFYSGFKTSAIYCYCGAGSFTSRDDFNYLLSRVLALPRSGPECFRYFIGNTIPDITWQ
jgi:hypothetical protein